MDLYNISLNNRNWETSKNILYVNKIAKIPLLLIENGEVWIFFDKKIYKDVLKISKILLDEKINFSYRSTDIFFAHKFTESQFHYKNLYQCINNITFDKLYDGFNKIGIDFVKILANYVEKYKCGKILKEVCKLINKDVNSKAYNYFTGLRYYVVEREDIRNYISSIEREIIMRILF